MHEYIYIYNSSFEWKGSLYDIIFTFLERKQHVIEMNVDK